MPRDLATRHLALWAAKVARSRQETATDGKVGGNNGKDVRECGHIRATMPAAVRGRWCGV